MRVRKRIRQIEEENDALWQAFVKLRTDIDEAKMRVVAGPPDIAEEVRKHINTALNNIVAPIRRDVEALKDGKDFDFDLLKAGGQMEKFLEQIQHNNGKVESVVRPEVMKRTALSQFDRISAMANKSELAELKTTLGVQAQRLETVHQDLLSENGQLKEQLRVLKNTLQGLITDGNQYHGRIQRLERRTKPAIVNPDPKKSAVKKKKKRTP